jgi:hypothetical protein
MRGKPVCCDDARHALILSVPFLLLLWLFPSSFGQRACSQTSSSQTSTDPNKLVRRVIANELKSQEQDHRHWSFRLNTEKPHGQTEVDEVVETKVGDLKRPLLINGREPGSEQQQEASQRIRQLAQNPAPLRKARQEDDQDTVRSQRLFDAFTFSYGQRRRDLIEPKFSPHPKFHPQTHEAEVFHAMNGSLWLDNKQERVEEISGRLVREVKFGGGVLGI